MYINALIPFISYTNGTASNEIPEPHYKFELNIPTQGSGWVIDNPSQNSTIITERMHRQIFHRRN